MPAPLETLAFSRESHLTRVGEERSKLCMLLNDKQILELAREGMIEPFQQCHITASDEGPVVSFGLSSFGYDIRLSQDDFRIFRHLPGKVVDPKNFNPRHVEKAQLQEDQSGKFFVLPGNSYGLGVAIGKTKCPTRHDGPGDWQKHLCAVWADRQFNTGRAGLARTSYPRIFEFLSGRLSHLRERRRCSIAFYEGRPRPDVLRRPRGQISGSKARGYPPQSPAARAVEGQFKF